MVEMVRDHPRSRGVYGSSATPQARISGSSPLARGLRAGPGCPAGGPGIIPARAGFTWRRSPRDRHRRDHPRSRGVYSAAATGAASRRGSSPLARGLRAPSRPLGRSAWIIPARAGFTHRRHERPERRPDHPRSRGVYLVRDATLKALGGSSPLARGLRDGVRHGGDAEGIIPARAGFTRGVTDQRLGLRDHPRSRGVYSSSTPLMTSAAGSSPLARGLPESCDGVHRIRGIIPARAGFTRRLRAGARPRRDHPRSRGVYRRATWGCGRPVGSSPLARGLPDRGRQGSGRHRIIPARAGFTPSNCPGPT